MIDENCYYCGSPSRGILVYGRPGCAPCLDDARIGYLQPEELIDDD